MAAISKKAVDSQTGFSKYETGENDVSTSALIALAQYYHVRMNISVKPVTPPVLEATFSLQ